MKNLKATSEVRKMRFGGQELSVQCIIPRHSKAIIDQIDMVLASHFGFSQAASDFVFNYDIKYRLGADDDEE
jgi:hypothetical protein